MAFKINHIVDTCQIKDNTFDSELSFDSANIWFKERPEILEQFDKLKEIESKLKEYNVSIGISMGIQISDFNLSIKS